MKNTFYCLDDEFYISADLMEQICSGKRVVDNTFIVDESKSNGYIVKFEDDTLEIYVPYSVDGNDLILEDVSERIPDEYKYRVKNVIFGNRIKDISKCNFEQFGNIETVYLGADVEVVAPLKFYANFSLSKFIVCKDNEFLKSYKGDLFSYDMKKLIKYAQGKNDSFYKIPRQVEVVGSQAFSCACMLECIKVGANVKVLEPGAFFDCWCLRHIYVDKSVKSIQDSYIFGTHDELQVFLCEHYLVVGGEADSEIARWCDKYCVNFHIIENNEIDKFLVLPPRKMEDDEYWVRADKETTEKKKIRDRERWLHNQKVFEKYCKENSLT